MNNYFEYEALKVPASETLEEIGLKINPPMNPYNIESDLILDTPYVTRGLNLDNYFNTFNSPEMPNDNTPQYTSTALQHTGNGKQILEQALDKYGITGDKRTTLLKIAYLESRFNPKAQSTNSSAAGYFQMIDSTRRQYSNLSREQFKNSIDAQVLAASRLYDSNAKFLQRNGIKVTGEAIASCWLNPTWALNYFKYGKAGGSDANGTSISKYIKMYQNA